MISVLFICLGNICRSPMAEAYFRHIVKEAGLENKFFIDSAGIGSWHEGKAPHQGTIEKLKEKNIDFQGIKARQVIDKDFEQFDYIIAMDDQNLTDLANIRKKLTHAKVAKLMEFVEDEGIKNIPDPYYTGDFNQSYQLIETGCQSLLARIRTEHQI